MANIRFQLSHIVPMPMRTTIGERRGGDAYLVGISWWQWCDRVWGIQESAVKIP